MAIVNVKISDYFNSLKFVIHIDENLSIDDLQNILWESFNCEFNEILLFKDGRILAPDLRLAELSDGHSDSINLNVTASPLHGPAQEIFNQLSCAEIVENFETIWTPASLLWLNWFRRRPTALVITPTTTSELDDIPDVIAAMTIGDFEYFVNEMLEFQNPAEYQDKKINSSELLVAWGLKDKQIVTFNDFKRLLEIFSRPETHFRFSGAVRAAFMAANSPFDDDLHKNSVARVQHVAQALLPTASGIFADAVNSSIYGGFNGIRLGFMPNKKTEKMLYSADVGSFVISTNDLDIGKIRVTYKVYDEVSPTGYKIAEDILQINPERNGYRLNGFDYPTIAQAAASNKLVLSSPCFKACLALRIGEFSALKATMDFDYMLPLWRQFEALMRSGCGEISTSFNLKFMERISASINMTLGIENVDNPAQQRAIFAPKGEYVSLTPADLLPKGAMEVIDSKTPSLLKQYDFSAYHGIIDDVQTASRLKGKPKGSYLLKDANTDDSSKILAFVDNLNELQQLTISPHPTEVGKITCLDKIYSSFPELLSALSSGLATPILLTEEIEPYPALNACARAKPWKNLAWALGLRDNPSVTRVGCYTVSTPIALPPLLIKNLRNVWPSLKLSRKANPAVYVFIKDKFNSFEHEVIINSNCYVSDIKLRLVEIFSCKINDINLSLNDRVLRDDIKLNSFVIGGSRTIELIASAKIPVEGILTTLALSDSAIEDQQLCARSAEHNQSLWTPASVLWLNWFRKKSSVKVAIPTIRHVPAIDRMPEIYGSGGAASSAVASSSALPTHREITAAMTKHDFKIFMKETLNFPAPPSAPSASSDLNPSSEASEFASEYIRKDPDSSSVNLDLYLDNLLKAWGLDDQETITFDDFQHILNIFSRPHFQFNFFYAVKAAFIGANFPYATSINLNEIARVQHVAQALLPFASAILADAANSAICGGVNGVWTGFLPRDEAEKLLRKDGRDGAFLVRLSTTRLGYYVISRLNGRNIVHELFDFSPKGDEIWLNEIFYPTIAHAVTSNYGRLYYKYPCIRASMAVSHGETLSKFVPEISFPLWVQFETLMRAGCGEIPQNFDMKFMARISQAINQVFEFQSQDNPKLQETIFKGPPFSHQVEGIAEIFRKSKDSLCRYAFSGFHGPILYDKTVELLSNQPQGSYLLRPSQAQRGSVTLAYVDDKGIPQQSIISPYISPEMISTGKVVLKGKVQCSEVTFKRLLSVLLAYSIPQSEGANALLKYPVEPYQKETVRIKAKDWRALVPSDLVIVRASLVDEEMGHSSSSTDGIVLSISADDIDHTSALSADMIACFENFWQKVIIHDLMVSYAVAAKKLRYNHLFFEPEGTKTPVAKPVFSPIKFTIKDRFNPFVHKCSMDGIKTIAEIKQGLAKILICKPEDINLSFKDSFIDDGKKLQEIAALGGAADLELIVSAKLPREDVLFKPFPVTNSLIEKMLCAIIAESNETLWTPASVLWLNWFRQKTSQPCSMPELSADTLDAPSENLGITAAMTIEDFKHFVSTVVKFSPNPADFKDRVVDINQLLLAAGLDNQETVTFDDFQFFIDTFSNAESHFYFSGWVRAAFMVANLSFAKDLNLNPVARVQHVAQALLPIASAIFANTINNSIYDNIKGAWAGFLPRDKAQQLLLEDGRDGVFLVRASNTRPGDYAISFLKGSEIFHVLGEVDFIGAGSILLGKNKYPTLANALASNRHIFKYPCIRANLLVSYENDNYALHMTPKSNHSLMVQFETLMRAGCGEIDSNFNINFMKRIHYNTKSILEVTEEDNPQLQECLFKLGENLEMPAIKIVPALQESTHTRSIQFVRHRFNCVHGNLTFDNVKARLKDKPPGSYLIKASQGKQGSSVIAFIDGAGKIQQCMVDRNGDRGEVLSSGRTFPSLFLVVLAYTIPPSQGATALFRYAVHPFPNKQMMALARPYFGISYDNRFILSADDIAIIRTEVWTTLIHFKDSPKKSAEIDSAVAQILSIARESSAPQSDDVLESGSSASMRH